MRLLPLLSFILTGCAAWRIAPPVDDLTIRTPGSWSAVSTGSENRITTGWLDSFTDPGLKSSVREALTYNRDLMAASSRLREAKENSLISQAGSLPQVNTSAGGSFTDTNTAPVRENYSLNLSASWEPDLWGRLRDLNHASGSEYRAAMEDYRGARLSLAANTAKAWCNLISAQQELDLAGVTLAAFEKSLRIIERNYKSTGEGALDVRFARTNVSSARRSIESRRLDLNEAARSLELLLGRYPAGTTRANNELPTLSTTVPAGLPAELLERRPDLAAARARLLASARRADAAKKSLLPSFFISGNGGAPSDSLSKFLDPQELIASISGRVGQNLFDGGAEEASARAALSRNETLVHEYAQKALIAFREVEAALAADRSLFTQEDYLTAELRESTLAEKQAERNYSQGVNPNILSVLEAQRRANGARASMIRLRNQRLQTRINLHLALGGDFATRPGIP